MAGRALLGLLLTLAVGCSTGYDAHSRGPLLAVATTSAWGSVLAQLGGSRVHTVSLVSNPNADPHDYEPTPNDARTLAMARLVVENGIGYDAWAARILKADQEDNRLVVNVGDVTGVAAGGNPHRWYSPSDVERVADAITAAFERADPAHRAYFAANRERFDDVALAGYHALIAQISACYAGTAIGASESIVTPLAQALHLQLLTPPALLEAVSEGTDPTADDKTTADGQIRDHRIGVYIVNPQNSTPDVTAQVDAARATGIPVVTMTESLTPAGASFQSWQLAQLEQLRAALHEATGR